MKKILSFLIIFIVAFIPINVYADDASVNIKVVGKIEKGATIEILVNLKGVEKFYAASVDFTYDTNQLKVENIAATEFITKHVNDIMELGDETAKNGNTASYSFTFLGDKNGISGSGTLVKITANVLNNEKLSINQDNMKIKLVQRVGDTVENYSYNFSGYGTDAIKDGQSDITNSSNKEDVSGNKDDNSNNGNGSSNNSVSNSNNKENVSENKNDNSTSSIGSGNNDVVNSNEINTSNDSSSNIDIKDNKLNSNDEEEVKENTEKDENQTIDNKNESNNEVLSDKSNANKFESSSNGRNVIWIVVGLTIFGAVILGIKYHNKL